MKQFLVILTTGIYFSCFGASSSHETALMPARDAFVQAFLNSPRAQDPDNAAALKCTTDPGYIAFVDSRRNDPAVVAAISPLLRMLPGEKTLSYQFAYTSIGKNQLFVCLVIGKQLEKYSYPSLGKRGIAYILVQNLRAHWDLRLCGRDYTSFQHAGYKHYPYLLSRMDIRRAIAMVNSCTNEQLHQDGCTLVFFNTSAKGVQAFFYDHSEKFKERTYKSFKKVAVTDGGTLQIDTPKIIAYFNGPNHEPRAGTAKRLRPEDEQSFSRDFKGHKISDAYHGGVKKRCSLVEKLSTEEDEFEARHPEDELTDDEVSDNVGPATP
jgi:hypothetical protein